MQSNMTVDDAEWLVQGVRERILGLFPDGDDTYELIYAPRFRRLITSTPAPHARCRDPVPRTSGLRLCYHSSTVLTVLDRRQFQRSLLWLGVSAKPDATVGLAWNDR